MPNGEKLLSQMPKSKFPFTVCATLALAIPLLCATPCIAQDQPAPDAEQNMTLVKAGRNPPPLEKLSGFQHFELMPLTSGMSVKGDVTVAKIQDIINERVRPAINGWNEKSADVSIGRTLVIQPHVDSLKFASVGKRIFLGVFAGSSHAQLSARYFDKASGMEIAQPKFFSSVATMSGAFTMGGQDIAMLYRVVSLFNDYTQANYDAQVGGNVNPNAE